MPRRSEPSRSLLPILICVFTLLILLLGASGYVAVSAIRTSESDAAQILGEQRAAMRLIADVHLEEDSLSSIFYMLATRPGGGERQQLSDRLGRLQETIGTRSAQGLNSPEAAIWRRVRAATDSFIAEGRLVLRTGQSPREAFFRTHEQLADGVADLANAIVERGALNAREESERARSRVKYSLLLLGIAVAVASLAAGFTVYIVIRMFAQLSWAADELSDLSSRGMSDREETARRFSHELHDHFGQILNAVQANLVAMKHAGQYSDSRMEDCLALVADAIGNVREVSQLLRPIMLDDFGLDASLRWLAETFAERMGIPVAYTSSFSDRFADERETQLFRIAQEALTNVSRHAAASSVTIDLSHVAHRLILTIADDGRGMSNTLGGHGLGLAGMRARAKIANALLRIESNAGSGVNISVELPLDATAKPLA